MMRTQQQNQHWNVGAKEKQKNPGGPDQRQSIKPPTNLIESV